MIANTLERDTQGPDEPTANGAADILRHYNCRVVYATTDGEAQAALAEILGDAAAADGVIAIDVETMPSSAARDRLGDARRRKATAQGTARALTKLDKAPATVAATKVEARRAAAAAAYAERAGLDPHRAEIRLLQAYAGGRHVLVAEMSRVSFAALEPLWDAPLVAHNAAFELSFLDRLGIEPAEMHCTMQAVRLLNGVGAANLSDAAATFLGLALDKSLQVSDWSAQHLTLAQLNYAATDAVVTWHLAEKVLPRLADTALAYAIQIAATPAAVRMMNRGFRLDVDTHAALMLALEEERRAAERAYTAACLSVGRPDLAKSGVPATPAEKVALLEALLTSTELATWTRTAKSGLLSTRRAELRRAAHYPPIAILSALAVLDKQLAAFGPTLIAQVSPVTGRIHAHYGVAAASSGRATCSAPNVQQIPRDKRFRALFVADTGNVLVAADYSSMELRAAAEISGDSVMREAFAQGNDLHRLTAAKVIGKPPEAVTDEERSAAKRVNFGAAYGMGAAGLVKGAWDAYGVVLTPAEAATWLRGFSEAFPTFARWRYEHFGLCEARGTIVIGKNAASGHGRVFRRAWLPPGCSLYTRACNLPIQGICADASMLALAAIDRMLFGYGIDGGPVAWLHDEIVLEVSAEHAALAERLLVEAMESAFAETFPGAPLNGLVEANSGLNWAAAKEKTA